jgi:hypothetical protein
VLQSLLGCPPFLWIQLQHTLQKLQEAKAALVFIFFLFRSRDRRLVWNQFNHALQRLEVEILFGWGSPFVFVAIELLHRL